MSYDAPNDELVKFSHQCKVPTGRTGKVDPVIRNASGKRSHFHKPFHAMIHSSLYCNTRSRAVVLALWIDHEGDHVMVVIYVPTTLATTSQV